MSEKTLRKKLTYVFSWKITSAKIYKSKVLSKKPVCGTGILCKKLIHLLTLEKIDAKCHANFPAAENFDCNF